MSPDTPNRMTTAPVNAMLVRMAAPISLGMLSTFLFQAVDTFFVGRIGSNELAALAFSSTAYFLFVAIFMGLSVGVSAVVAKTAGAGQPQLARGLATVSVCFVAVLAVALGVSARSVIEPMFKMLGAGDTILPLIQTYMGILYLGFPLLTIGIIGSGAIRAIGVTGKSEIVFAIGGVVNLVFDWLLIFGIGPFPEMGLAGAAWASVLSFLFIFVGMMVLMRRNRLLGLARFREGIAGLKDIIRFGVPTVAMQLLIPITGMLMTVLLAPYGPEAVAAFGIASRVESLALVGLFAVSMSVTPFVAQNFGAAEHDRIDEALLFGGKAAIYLGAALFVLLGLLGPWVARIFSDDPDVIRFVSLYFRIVALSYAFQGVLNVMVSAFNGLQMPGTALRIMLVRTFMIVTPLLLLGASVGVTWILVGQAAGNILAATYASHVLRDSQRTWRRPMAEKGLFRHILDDALRVGRSR